MYDELMIQAKDRNSVMCLNYHNIGGGGVDNKGSSLQNVTLISLRRIAQISTRSLKAAGLKR